MRDDASLSGGSNAKPRDDFAGLHRFATCRGFIPSRHRDACRSVPTGFGVKLSWMSSIGLLSSYDFTLPMAVAKALTARLASRPLSYAPVLRAGTILKHHGKVGRCPFASGTPATGARTTANIRAATGSSVVSLKIRPEPNHRSAFSSRLSLVQVKPNRRLVAGWSDLGQ